MTGTDSSDIARRPILQVVEPKHRSYEMVKCSKQIRVKYRFLMMIYMSDLPIKHQHDIVGISSSFFQPCQHAWNFLVMTCLHTILPINL